MMNLKNKIVLVTGSGSGIGRAIAIAFAEKGATILVHYRKNQEGAQTTLEEVKKHSEGKLYQSDLCNNAEVVTMFETILLDHQTIDILVNNAGDAKPGDIFDTAMWKYQLDTILMSTVYTSQAFLKLKSNDQRKIINITSLYGDPTTSNPEFMSYSAAKAAVSNLTMSLAKKLGKQVLVNAIAPGYTWTPAWKGISKDDKQEYEEATKIGRFIEPSEIAHTALWLAENDAMTGKIIPVDGGLSLVDLK